MLRTFLLVLLGISLFGSSLAQICTTELGIVTADDNGTLMFPPLPPGADNINPSYDPALEVWYDLASSFIDVVRSGSLPYDVIRDAINDNNIQCDIIEPEPARCTTETETGDFDPMATLEEFADWWIPILVVTCLGGIMACAFCVTGCVFWCCRCCGQCGGSRKQQESSYMDCKSFIFAAILLVFNLVLLVGVIFAFFTNEQAYSSAQSFQDTINTVVDHGLDFVDDSMAEGDSLLCQFSGIADLLVIEAEGANASVIAELDRLEAEANSTLDMLEDLAANLTQDGIDDIITVLMEVDNTTMELLRLSDEVDMSLMTIADDVTQLNSDCISASLGAACDQIPDPSIFVLNADYSQLPNVTDAIQELEDTSIADIDITQEIDEHRDEFAQSTQDVRDEVSEPLADFTNEITEVNDTIFSEWADITETIDNITRDDQDPDECPETDFCTLDFSDDPTVGEIRECVFNQCFDNIQERDVYRYAFGIVVCSLALIVFILVAVGIVLGVVGFRRDKRPYERTCLSHCGGIFLLIAVGLAFFFAYFLMALAAVGFFFGANALKACQALESPDYELFAEIVDNTELWGGSLMGSVIFGNASQIFSLSGALRNCRDNQALYTAFNLSNLFDVREELLDLQEVIDTLQGDIENATNSFLENYDPEDILNITTRNSLDEFVNDTISTQDIEDFRTQIDSNILGFDFDQERQTLVTFRDALPPGQVSLINSTQSIIDQLDTLNNTTIPAITLQLDELERNIDDLDEVVSESIEVSLNITDIADDLSNEALEKTLDEIVGVPINRSISYIEQFLDHFADEIEMNIARCQPLYGVYEELYTVVCEEAVDALNGFWWSLGFCTLIFIPLIVFAVITSTFYIRMKYYNYDDTYSDFPMKSY